MDSFFFNVTDNRYRVTDIFRDKKSYLKRVDISNGIVFFKGTLLAKEEKIELQNLDRMIMIVVVQEGNVALTDHLTQTTMLVKEGYTSMYASSKQDMTITMEKKEKSNVFILVCCRFFSKKICEWSSQ